MTPAEVARALVARRRFEWRRGMSDTNGNIHVRAGWGVQDGTLFRDKPDPEVFRINPDDYYAPDPGEEAPPDLSDPATAGVLVHMLRETGCLWSIDTMGPEWSVCIRTGIGATQGFKAEHLGEAAARALLAIWSNA